MEKDHFHIFEKEISDEKAIHYDVCIIGGGPAGLTAAIYSSRYGLHTALITKNVGGMANLAEKIENYPGYEGTGFELMQKFWKQAKKCGTETLSLEVKDVKKDETGFILELNNEKVVHTKSLIVALGTEKRKLNVPGEEKFLGKGISYCATCDAMFFKDKVVGIIGGSNSAAKAGLVLSKLAKKVYIIYRKDKLRCDDLDKKNLKKLENVEIIYNSIPIKINGDKSVKSIEIESGGKKKSLDVDGIFVEIGSTPVSALTQKLKIKMDKQGFIVVDDEMKTNVNGIFAAGDLIKSKLKQIVVAAAQGAIAAKSAQEYISK